MASIVVVGLLLVQVALLGVLAVAVWMWVREHRAMRDQRRQDGYRELLRMAMTDPDLAECWGPVPEGRSVTAQLQRDYVNQLISQLENGYKHGLTSREQVKFAAGSILAAEPGRRFWAEAREDRAQTAVTRRQREFHELVDSLYSSDG